MRTNRFLAYFIAILIGLVALIHVAFILRGYYLTGDTISYLQDAFRGKPLSVFIQANPTWPPATSLIFNFFRLFSNNVFIQQKAYVLGLFVFNIFVLYLLVRDLVDDPLYKVSIAVLSLLAGIHSLLSVSAISEPFFILSMHSSLLFLIRYYRNRKEKDLMFFALCSSLLPLSRYIGIYVLSGYSTLLGYLLFVRREKVESRYFLGSVIVMIWLPLFLYLFRNKLLIGMFLEKQQVQMPDINLFTIFFRQNMQMFGDIWPALIAMLGMGFLLPNKKNVRIALFLTFSTLLLYQGGLALSKNLIYFRKDTFLLDNFPSRYMAVTYPLTLLFFLYMGNFIGRFVRRKRLATYAIGLIVTVSLIFTVAVVGIRLYREAVLGKTQIAEADYSPNIERFCGDRTVKKYVLVQDTSSNHVARGIHMLCGNTAKLQFLDGMKFETGSLVFSPYRLNEGFEVDETYDYTKKVYRYKAVKDTVLNAYSLRKNLELLD